MLFLFYKIKNKQNNAIKSKKQVFSPRIFDKMKEEC